MWNSAIFAHKLNNKEMAKCNYLLLFFIISFYHNVYAKNLTTQIFDNKLPHNKYFLLTEFNFSPGFGNTIYLNNKFGNNIRNKDLTHGFRIINGIKLKERLTLGIGGGVILSKIYNSSPLIPITFDCRFFFLKSSNKPYININTGYAIFKYVLGNSIQKGGMLINPSIGIQKLVFNKYSCMISLGYCLQFRSLTFDSKLSANVNSAGDQLITYYLKNNLINQFISINLGFGLN
jgi:hypothetical protein